MITNLSDVPEQISASDLNEDSQKDSPDESSANEESLNELDSPSESNGEAAPDVSVEMQKMNSSLQEMKLILQEKEKLLQMNAEMHEELVKLRNDFANEIKRPLLMGLVQIYDRIEDLVRANACLAETETVAIRMRKTLNDIRLNCLDVLYEFDIEPVEPQVGEIFNPKLHKAIKAIATDESAKDKTVAFVRQVGFVNVSSSRMVRASCVEVYKKQE